MRHAAMLWTGGKDSALALSEAKALGYTVRCLVTFAPPNPTFLAHPMAFIELQAQALGLPHRIVTVSKPLEYAYEAGLSQLRDETGIDGVITGDIAEVDGHPNWIRERSTAIGMRVSTPLWGRDRTTLLRRLRRAGFRIRISCVDTRRMSRDWVCTAPGFLDSGLTVFASTLPRPARRGRVAPGPGFDSRISPASTVRCMSA